MWIVHKLEMVQLFLNGGSNIQISRELTRRFMRLWDTIVIYGQGNQ